MTAPHTIAGTINLVTELLPIPLPIQTRRALTQEESDQAIKLRKLWSAHLYCLGPTIHELIYRLGLATHPTLTHALRRLCVALSDLAAPIAILVARSVLDLVLHTQRLDQKLSSCGDEGSILVTPPCSPQTARVLNMVAAIVSHAPTKVAILYLLKGGSQTLGSSPSKGDDKYISVLPNWCQALSFESKSPAHCQAQESLINIFQFFCNHDNTMKHPQDQTLLENCSNGPNNKSSTPIDSLTSSPAPLVSLAYDLSAMPHKDQLISIFDSLLDYVSNESSTDSSIQLALKTLIKFIEHDFGLYLIKIILDKKKQTLHNLLKKLHTSFQSNKLETVPNLQSFFELCLYLLNKENKINNPLRTLSASNGDLALYLAWKSNDISDLLSNASNVNSPAVINTIEKKENIENIKCKTEVKQEEVVEPKVEENIDIKVEKDVEMTEVPEEQAPSQDISNDIEKEEVESKEKVFENIHVLKLLENLISIEKADDENLQVLYEDLMKVLTILEGDLSSTTDIKDILEPNLTTQESLQGMFASRTIWSTLTEDDDTAYWLTAPTFDEIDESETVKANLVETCRQYAADYDLLGTLHKLVKGHASQTHTPQKLNLGTTRFKPSTAAIRPDKRGRPYVAPMRGRSFTRGMNMRSDPFRSRPPNTSRPPSVHVDVFQALESTGNQPTGPTG